jgi:hypothetical protein
LVGRGEITCDGTERAPKPVADERLLASYTFDQLGIGDALRSLIVGELHVFVSADGTTFDEAELPGGVHGNGTLVSTDDGYALFASTWDRSGNTVTTLRSADARSWTIDDGLTMRGYVAATGTIGGRTAAILSADRSGAVLQMQQPDGSWLPLDLGAAVAQHGTTPGATMFVNAADIGPLGAAAVIAAYDEAAQSEQRFLVYSPDGRSVSVQPLADVPGAPQGYAGAVRVSADAVTVVFGDDRDDDGVVTSTLLVGTP